MRTKSKYLKDVPKIEKNCLIFWPGHVAIAISNNTIIHSNAFHMCVKIEKLEELKSKINNIVADIQSEEE